MPYFYAPAFVEDNGIAAGTNIQHYATDESQMPNGDGVEAWGQMEEDLIGAKGDNIGANVHNQNDNQRPQQTVVRPLGS
jgi:hypothetical protein